jgi:predicted adenine nucleotide alpha hydrolase (AANH) superfamily ATPase
MLAEQMQLKVITSEGYALENWLRNVVHREANRCRLCYYERLRSTALVAKRGKFDGFTSTLLYSKHQSHEEIRSLGESVAAETGIAFIYRDFRPGWKQGVEASKHMGLYRQQYCGCIYSEKERYFRESTNR